VVTVVDDVGDPIDDATVTWSTDDDTDEPCDASGNVYSCARELHHFGVTIRVVRSGFTPFETTVHVSAFECQVVTEMLEVELDPAI